MILTEYERNMFYNLEHNIPDYRWWVIESDRKDKHEFIDMIKKRIDIYNDFEFNGDYTKFRKMEPWDPNPSRQMTYRIDWLPDKMELNDYEKNLQPVTPKKLTREQDKAYQARRTDK